MDLCNNCDIVFTERTCPLCTAKKEILELTEKIEELEKKIYEGNV